MNNKLTVTVEDRHFGGYDEVYEVNTKEELETLRDKLKKYPQTKDFSTTITIAGNLNGEYYFEQIL